MLTCSAYLAICAGNSPIPGEFPAQRPMTQSFGVFSDLRLNKRLSKQSPGWWFETLSRPLWRHRNVTNISMSHALNEHIYQIRCLEFDSEMHFSYMSCVHFTNWLFCFYLLYFVIFHRYQRVPTYNIYHPCQVDQRAEYHNGCSLKHILQL